MARIAFLRVLPCVAILIAACAAPRSVLLSPEATPKGGFRVGGGLGVNFPTETSRALYGGLGASARALWSRSAADTLAITADSLNDLARALIAFSLDPLAMPMELHARYGFAHRADAGYRYAGGVHALDVRLQFLGPEAAAAPGWRGSVAAQLSMQSYELPSTWGLDKLQSLLQYEFTRKDVLVPVVLGKPLGAQGRYGSFGVGLAYDLSLVEWDSRVLKLVERVDANTVRPFAPLRGERAISSYGGFANVRAGYRFLFVLAALSVYWQDYGSFPLFGNDSVAFTGWTMLPTLGLELNF